MHLPPTYLCTPDPPIIETPCTYARTSPPARVASPVFVHPVDVAHAVVSVHQLFPLLRPLWILHKTQRGSLKVSCDLIAAALFSKWRKIIRYGVTKSQDTDVTNEHARGVIQVDYICKRTSVCLNPSKSNFAK